MSHRTPRTARVGVIALLGSALVLSPLAAAPAFAADGPTITFLNINDFHGRIDSDTLKFADTIEKAKAAAANPVLLSAGDNLGASEFASATADDKPTIDVLNELGLQASAVGNHEFDRGYDHLVNTYAAEADFPYLGANVYTKGTTTPALPAYTTIDVAGVTVGIIGAVTQETPSLVSPGGISGLDFGDPVAAVNRVANQLTDGDASNGEADVIVAEYHEGATSGSSTLAAQVAAGGAFANIVNNTSAKVAAIFTGHTHQTYAWDAPIPGSSATRPIIQTGSYGVNVGQTALHLTETNGAYSVASYTNANIPRVASVPQSDIDGSTTLQQVQTTVNNALAAAAVIGSQKIGAVTKDITTAFSGGSYVNGVYTGGTRDDRTAESTLGNLVADSLLSTLKDPSRGGAQIGVTNPGGVRADLLYGSDGSVTYQEANDVLPFVNNLWTTSLTGAQFKQALEQQWQPDGSSRTFLNLGLSDNVRYTYDASRARGDRITGIWIDGKPISATASYRVGSFNFLLQGGDNFTAFASGTDTRDSGLIDRDAWISYLQTHNPVAPNVEKHGVQVTGETAKPKAGGAFSFSVSNVDLTSLGAPQNTILRVELGSKKLATKVPVTGGKADVTVTLPKRISGATSLTVTFPASHTVVTLPVTIAPASTTVATLPKTSVAYGRGAVVKAKVVGSSTTGAVKATSGKVRFSYAKGKSTGSVTATVNAKGIAKTRLPAKVAGGTYAVTARYLGTAKVKASTSEPVALQVTRVDSKLRIAVDQFVKRGARMPVRITTKKVAPGVPVTGTVKIKITGAVAKTVTLKKSDHGTKTVRLAPKWSKKAPGTIRRIKATFVRSPSFVHAATKAYRFKVI